MPAVAALPHRRLAADTDWWSGDADLLTFEPVELIATKFRALAQRSKGRDLNDLDVAYRQLDLRDGPLGRAAAHYLLHANVHPGEFRARLAAHLGDADFVADVARYLIDPATAGDPHILVTRWIRWTDLHLDLAFAQLAWEREPSRRKSAASMRSAISSPGAPHNVRPTPKTVRAGAAARTSSTTAVPAPTTKPRARERQDATHLVPARGERAGLRPVDPILTRSSADQQLDRTVGSLSAMLSR